jgi:hypothetical protein
MMNKDLCSECTHRLDSYFADFHEPQLRNLITVSDSTSSKLMCFMLKIMSIIS